MYGSSTSIGWNLNTLMLYRMYYSLLKYSDSRLDRSSDNLHTSVVNSNRRNRLHRDMCFLLLCDDSRNCKLYSSRLMSDNSGRNSGS